MRRGRRRRLPGGAVVDGRSGVMVPALTAVGEGSIPLTDRFRHTNSDTITSEMAMTMMGTWR